MASQPLPGSSSSQGPQNRKRALSPPQPQLQSQSQSQIKATQTNSQQQQPEKEKETELQIYKSKEITDRSSTFIGAFAPTSTPRTLQLLPEFKSASHRILAWRQRARNQQTTLTGFPQPKIRYDLGSDDDGEKYAGKRAERVLEEMQVEGAVVVARWYGGVLLGPVRFAHIEKCAREAVGMWQLAARRHEGIDGSQGGVDGSNKRRRVDGGQSNDNSPGSHLQEQEEEEDLRSKDELVKVLAERDESIKILRALLAEKLGKTAEDTAASTTTTTTLTKKTSPPPKYEAMPVIALRRLEKARDSTLAWILKEIDKAEGGE